jgi:hypothetical protein
VVVAVQKLPQQGCACCRLLGFTGCLLCRHENKA